jgi:hypothetical protein
LALIARAGEAVRSASNPEISRRHHEIQSSQQFSMLYFSQGLLNMKKIPTQPPIPDRGNPRMTPLNLPCGKDLNHLRIQSGDGLNLTAFLDHLATCEKCS